MNESPILQRRAKDSVFRKLFEDRENVLRLYRAIHPEDEAATADDIEIVTIKNILTANIYNDLGFTVGSRLIVLVEAQSVWNANILPRSLLYLAHTYQRLISKNDWNLFARAKVPLPEPELYVVYTGEENVRGGPHSLADEFFGGSRKFLDVNVHVLREGSPGAGGGGAGGDILSQYVAFTKVLDGQARVHGRTLKAVSETIRICRDGDILREFLKEHEQEVKDIMTSLFDEEEIQRKMIKDAKNEGLGEGWDKGWGEGWGKGWDGHAVETAKKMIGKSMPSDLIADISGLPIERVNALEREV